jgi:hypothetical protein
VVFTAGLVAFLQYYTILQQSTLFAAKYQKTLIITTTRMMLIRLIIILIIAANKLSILPAPFKSFQKDNTNKYLCQVFFGIFKILIVFIF